MSLLEIKNLSMEFGGLRALSNFDFTLDPGQLVGLIGPNGAGKTTVFNVVTGVYAPTRGDVTLADHSIAGEKPFRVNRRGIARTFQNIRLFGELTVLDNVKIGCQMRRQHGIWATVLSSNAAVASERAVETRSLELLEVFNLTDRRNEQAKNLSYGDQRRLEIASNTI